MLYEIQVKLLHEVSDDDLLRELERRERSSLGKGSLGGASPGRGGSMEGASPRRGGSREEGRGEGEAGADVFLVDRNASSQRTPSLAAEEYVDKGWEEESARRRQLVNQVQQAEVARMGERAQEFGAPKLVGTAIEAKVSDPPRNAPVGAMEAFRDPQMEQPSVLDARVWSKVEASASFFPEPAPQHEPNNEAEMKTSPETEVDQEKKGSLFPEASEEMRRAAPIIQSVLRGRLARQTLSALLEREQRLAEQV